MAIIKCKMCGGDIELVADKSFGTCEFCGSTMTLPKIDDEQRAAAFNRGNHFRRIGEFDKALAVYERIVREDDTDAEAHWCCALCRFGIEYVEDPATYEYLPTCHRASFDSFLEDVDYLAAVEHSEGVTRRQYQKDAAKIAEVQRGILATSQNAEPYDVFICYKESDANGDRTRDSLLAQDIYYQLTEQGRKVFYARITLEDVAGAQYEPYIFAALNSAKVMIVVGTKAEHLNAVWVKNEWSRFLAMVKKDRHKLLLPCYRDMDPYDMPEQLSILQSYDMSKIGFIQDLTRGISKVLDAEKKPELVKETAVMQQSAGNTAPLLKRAFMFLEDGDWNSANEYCEKVLDMDPENPQAYLGKLMAELRVKNQEDLRDQAQPFNRSNNFQKVLRFADEPLRSTLVGYIEHINTRNENARLEGIYTQAKNTMSAATTEIAYKEAARLFEKISEYRDSASLIPVCYEEAEIARKEAIYGRALIAKSAAMTESDYKEAARLFETIREYRDSIAQAKVCYEKAEAARERAEAARKDEIYQLAKTRMNTQVVIGDPTRNYREAIQKFESIPGWKDADEKILVCQQKIEEIQAQEEADRLERESIAKKKKKIGIIAAAAVCVIVAFIILLNTVIIPNGKYNDAVALMDAGKYTEAINAFEALDGYKDSAAKINECNTAILDGKYNDAVALMDAGKYAEAINAFEALDGYKDSAAKINECNTAILDSKYNDAVALMNAGKYAEAINAFEALDGYKDSTTKNIECKYAYAVALMDAGKYAEAINAFEALGNYSDAKEQAEHLWSKVTVRETLSEGVYHTVGLKADGRVVAAGSNGDGQCRVSGWEDIVAISADGWHTVGLKADGTVVAAGYNDDGQCDVSGWEDIVAISAGSSHTVGLKADGTVVAVGDNDYGQCDVSGWKDIVAISAGGHHTVGLKADGTVVAVGYNNSGQCNVSGWRDIIAISAGFWHTVGLKADGTVVAVGASSDGQCDVSGWRNIRLPD